MYEIWTSKGFLLNLYSHNQFTICKDTIYKFSEDVSPLNIIKGSGKKLEWSGIWSMFMFTKMQYQKMQMQSCKMFLCIKMTYTVVMIHVININKIQNPSFLKKCLINNYKLNLSNNFVFLVYIYISHRILHVLYSLLD